MSWWARLDEWQHRHMPDGERHPRLQLWWDRAWSPYCDWVDRRYLA